MMRRAKITISENGTVCVPNGKIMMSEYEIAELLGVMVPTVRGKIQTLLKSRMCVENCGGIVRGNRLNHSHSNGKGSCEFGNSQAQALRLLPALVRLAYIHPLRR